VNELAPSELKTEGLFASVQERKEAEYNILNDERDHKFQARTRVRKPMCNIGPSHALTGNRELY
jgi:hypothetical protein